MKVTLRRNANKTTEEGAAADCSKQKTKFVPLSDEFCEFRLSEVKLPGRHWCECQATKHALINNCLTCGHIVCEQEGSGPCLFCGSLVCTPDEQIVLNESTKKSAKLHSKLMALGDSESGRSTASLQDATGSLRKAIENKNRLLEYDRSSEKRTAIIDDECDYFNYQDSWLSPEEREKLRKKHDELRTLKFTPRHQLKFTLDFAGRRIVTEEVSVDLCKEPDQEESGKSSVNIAELQRQIGVDRNRFHDQLQYIPTVDHSSVRHQSNAHESACKEGRLQGSDLELMTDDGKCLSLHQPYASLLVAGIKRHEGRTWYSPHRGRLWIAAAAYRPQKEEIDTVEQFYSRRLGDGVRFPDNYPTSCLLGCVDVVECLPQEQYLLKYHEGESESQSPYVFICSNAQELTTKVPISGSHKIYKLDSNTHRAVKNLLMKKT